jgi:hypothetical protein
MFRPYRGDIGVLTDRLQRNSCGPPESLGLDLGASAIAELGVDFEFGWGHSRSGNKWKKEVATWSLLDFVGDQDVNSDGVFGYEPFYFKSVGDVTPTDDNYFNSLGGDHPVRIEMNSGGHLSTNLRDQNNTPYSFSGLTSKNRGEQRQYRNQLITYLNAEEASLFGLDKDIANYSFADETSGSIGFPVHTPRLNNHAKKDHLSEISVANPDGTRYVYGIPAYNLHQEEVSFRIAPNSTGTNYDLTNGLANYSAEPADASTQNNEGIDNMYNSTVLPAYAHSFLLTAVLSADYVDVKGDGITADDLGTAVKFNYTQMYGDNAVASGLTPYGWRYPYNQYSATLNQGYISDKTDDAASFVYGQKEIYYLQSIESKDFKAVFILDDRHDSHGVINRDGGRSAAAPLKFLKKIVLFSKRDLELNGNDMRNATPIKTVEFEYTYDLCKDVPNNDQNTGSTTHYGKLTLSKIYFSYGKSGKGRLNPYVFSYRASDPVFNPNYGLKSFDRWGNYKPPVSYNSTQYTLTNADFPYVDQLKRDISSPYTLKTDDYASSWHLTQIELPSGGIINVDYEADDYGYVQNNKAMQMFQVLGAASSADETLYENISDGTERGDLLYEATCRNDLGKKFFDKEGQREVYNYIFFEMDPSGPASSSNWANDISKYTGEIENMYFSFLVHLTSCDQHPGNERQQYPDMEYVTGYAQIDGSGVLNGGNTIDGKRVGYIKLRKPEVAGNEVNPISKVSWDFTQQNLQKLIYPTSNRKSADINSANRYDLQGMVDLGTHFSQMITGFYRTMQRKSYSLIIQLRLSAGEGAGLSN